MPYVVQKDGATIPRDLGTRKSLRSGKEFRINQTTVYNAGELLTDDEVSQVVKDKYDEGDEKVQSLIKKITKKQYDKAKKEASGGDLSRFQAEGGGPVDEPRKVQEAITRIDADYHQTDKAQVVAKATK